MATKWINGKKSIRTWIVCSLWMRSRAHDTDIWMCFNSSSPSTPCQQNFFFIYVNIFKNFKPNCNKTTQKHYTNMQTLRSYEIWKIPITIPQSNRSIFYQTSLQYIKHIQNLHIETHNISKKYHFCSFMVCMDRPSCVFMCNIRLYLITYADFFRVLVVFGGDVRVVYGFTFFCWLYYYF